MKSLLTITVFCLIGFQTLYAKAPPKDTLRVIAIFAHPDDADQKMGGTAILLAKMGAKVKFVSLTNGDAGHYNKGGGILANVRRAEAAECAKRLGIAEYTVLNNHDGELMPDLNTRMQVIKEIREWNADVVLGLRPNDYHPDHRNAGKLVEDASYMVGVPNVASDYPALKKNPVFLYMQDHFKKPNPLSHDIVVDIDEVYDQKINALDAYTSQFYEWLPWVSNGQDTSMVPKASDKAARKKWLYDSKTAYQTPSSAARTGLEKWYGKEKAAKVKFSESFEITEYGSQPTEEQIRKLFPMLGK